MGIFNPYSAVIDFICQNLTHYIRLKSIGKNYLRRYDHFKSKKTLWFSRKIQRLKGSCQVKKNPKIRQKLGLLRPSPPTPLSIFWGFFGNIGKHENNTHKKNTKCPKNLKSYFFYRFFDFFNLRKPLRIPG